jgi:hypothetical protein
MELLHPVKVLVILLYLYLADKAYGVNVRPFMLRVGACVFGGLLLGFTFASDWGGEKVLLLKRHRAEVSMSLWERHKPQPSMTTLGPDDLTVGRENSGSFWPDKYGPVLSESIREGIYKLPEIPIAY